MRHFWYHDFNHKREVTFNGHEVIKKVKFSDKKYIDHLKECYENLDRSKFKSKIIDFDYEIHENTITYTMPLINPEKFIGSDKNNNINIDCVKIDHVIQAYYDFIEPCDKGYPIHYDCAMKNYFIVDSNIMFIDVDSFVINPEKQSLILLFLLRCYQRITRNKMQMDFKKLYKELDSPTIEIKQFKHVLYGIPYHQKNYEKVESELDAIQAIIHV